MELKEQIISFVSEVLSQSGVAEDLSVLNTSGVLSDEQVRDFVMKLEEKFDVSITDEEAEKLVTVGDVIKLIEDKKKEVR